MCRLTVYKGSPILLGDIIVIPENSLVCQSRDAGYHPGVVDKSHVRNIRVNGDGFGVAFYGQAIQTGACLFKFVTPAWSNKNLISISQFVYSNLIMGHIRAATSGIDPFESQSVSIENCHPFKFGRWCLMHNGGIPHFSKIKLQLLNLLDADCFQFISGSTDSEHIFALFLSLLPDRSSQLDVRVITDALETTISVVLKLCELAGLNEACSLNLVVSDGIHVVATRFRNGTEAPPSLYYNYGNKFLSSEGTFQNPGNDESCEIVISSAPLCKDFYMEEDDDGVTGNNCGWRLAPKNTFLVCDGDTTDHAKISNIYIQTIHLKSARYLNKRLKIGASSFLSNFHLGAETSTAVLSSKQAVFPSPKRPESNSAGSMVSDQAMTKISEIQTSDSVESKSTLSTVTQTEDIESMESSRGEATALTSELSIYKKIFTHKSCAVEEYSQITPSSHCANDVKKTLRQPTFDKVPCCPEPHVVKTKNSFRASKTTLESYDIASKDSVEFLASLGSPFDTVNVTNSKKSPYKRFNWWWVIFDGCWKFLVLTLLIYIVVHSRKLNCETCPS